MTDAPDTVTEALTLLARDGYTDDFDVKHLKTACPGCGAAHDLGDYVIDRQYRFEGASNPEDEAIVLGLRCPTCGVRGVVVSAFGLDADPDLFAVLKRLPRG